MENTVLDLCHMNEELTEKLNAIADKSSCAYTEFIDTLSIDKKKNMYWWITPLVSRNVYLCNAFKEFCIVKLALEEVNNNGYDTVIVPSVAIKECLEANIISKEIKINTISGKKNVLDEVRWNLKSTLKRYLDIKKEVKNIEYTLPKNIILIDAYIESTSFKGDKYVDRSFNGLTEYNYHNKMFFLSYLLDDAKLGYKEFINRLQKETDYEFLIREKFISLFDFRIILYYLIQCTRFLKGKKVCDGIDYTTIINQALIAGMYNRNAYNGLLNVCMIKRMKRRYHLDIEQLVGHYEGQPSSNGLFFAFRREYADKRNLGYIASPGLAKQISLYPSLEQYRNDAVPYAYGIQGIGWLSFLSQFCDNVKYQIVPSFRYSHIFERKKIDGNDSHSGLKVLVVLSYFTELSRGLLNSVLKVYDDIQNEDVKIFIKNHPNNCGYTLEDYGIDDKPYKKAIVYESGSMDDAVRNKDIVLLVGTSSGLEILSTGVPIILYAVPSEIDLFGMPRFLQDEGCYIVYNAEQLVEAVYRLRDCKIKPEMIERILTEVFVPVNEKTVKQMLEGEIYENSSSNSGTL